MNRKIHSNLPSNAVVSCTQFLHFASFRLNSPFVPDKSKLVTGAILEASFVIEVNKLVVECKSRDNLIEMDRIVAQLPIQCTPYCFVCESR